jgi:hypothetical protein
VGLASVVAASIVGCGGGGAGPLAWQKDAGTSVAGVPVKTHQLAVTGLLSLGPIASRAVLIDVRPEHPTDAHGLAIRYAATTGRGAHIGANRGWRPNAWDLRRLSGFVMQPHTRVAVLIGAAAAKPGTYLLRGFVVDYRIGGTRYSAPQQIGLRVCASVPSCP